MKTTNEKLHEEVLPVAEARSGVSFVEQRKRSGEGNSMLGSAGLHRFANECNLKSYENVFLTRQTQRTGQREDRRTNRCNTGRIPRSGRINAEEAFEPDD